MQEISDGSDASMLSRLFDKAFAQYWMLLWNNHDYTNFQSFQDEMEHACAIWGYHMTSSIPQTRETQSSQESTGHSERVSSQTEIERHRKLNVLSTLQDAFQLLTVGCDMLAVVSRNDELDDVHTEHLKYLMLPFLTAHVMIEKPDVTNRINILRRCAVYLTEYMHTMATLKVLRENEATYWEQESEGSLAVRRNFKVASASFSIGITKTMSSVFHSPSGVERFFGKVNAIPSQDEESCRSTLMDIMRLFSVEAINTLSMIKSELPMLERRQRDSEYTANSLAEHRPQERRIGKPWFVQVDDVSKLDPTTAHFLYKSMIFVPGHKLPEISLEECARIEMEMDVNTIGSKGGDTKKASARITRTSETIDGSEEPHASDSGSDTDSTVEKAKWDDWKDDHPRGSGNKNRNVG